MRKATILQLLAQRTRLIGVGLAIMISVGFLAMTMLLGTVIEQTLRNSVGSEYRNLDFAIDSGDGSFTDQDIARIESLDGVADVQSGSATWFEVLSQGRTDGLVLANVPDQGPLHDALVLDSGHLPESSGEIVLERATAKRLRLEVGDSFAILVPPAGDADGDYVEQAVTLSGIWSGKGHYGSESMDGFLLPADTARWSPERWVTRLYVVADGDGSAALEQELVATAGASSMLTTREQLVDQDMQDRARELAVQRLGANAFAVLTLVVAGIVVSNTFAILVAQRTREIALFRCAGASASQMRTMVLAESAIVGLCASILGGVGALMLANVALQAMSSFADLPSVPSSIAMSSAAIMIPILVGVILAIVAAWAPARTATRVDPLLALRAASSPVGAGQRPGRIRIGVALLFLSGGAMLLFAGIFLSRHNSPGMGVLVGMVGGMTTFIGVLAGASVVVPATVAAFGSLLSRIGGVPARVAASNGIRNPRRTTTTTIALVIGVALVTMMSVGAASLKSTLFQQIDAETPWDVAVSPSFSSTDSPGELSEALGQIDDVVAVASLGRIEVELDGVISGETLTTDADVADPTAVAAVWRDQAAIAGFRPGFALVPAWVTETTDVVDGGPITLIVGARRLELTAITSEGFDGILITEQDVARLDITAEPELYWLRLDDDADANQVIDKIYALADDRGMTLRVDGMSDYRETLTSALDAMLLVVTALLGVAVLIAIIGVGNTLTLSVIERTRESALLRALGFTRRQLRQSLAVEGAMLAVIGSLIGIVLGVVFGWVGALTVVGNEWPVSLALPWTRIGLIVLVAIACGLAASILPARRAVQADPIVALAEV